MLAAADSGKAPADVTRWRQAVGLALPPISSKAVEAEQAAAALRRARRHHLLSVSLALNGRSPSQMFDEMLGTNGEAGELSDTNRQAALRPRVA